MPPVSPTLSLSHCRCPQVLRELHRSCQTEEGQDDLKKGTQLLEIYALEIQMHTEAKNSKKLKELYQVGARGGVRGGGWVWVWRVGGGSFGGHGVGAEQHMISCQPAGPATCCAFSMAHLPCCHQPPPQPRPLPCLCPCHCRPLPLRRKLWPSSRPSPTLASWE